jgi:putative Mn2+ efflux pump MntP
MEIIVVLLTGFALSMDAFAVAVSCGAESRAIKSYEQMRIALFFGFFQFFMPVVGWYLGLSIADHIDLFDHWIAAGLLFYIGGKMIYESFVMKKECPVDLGIKNMFILSVATSIDALAVGLSFALVGGDIWIPAAVIGIVTFSLSLFGTYIGKYVGSLLKDKASLVGGVVLIGIGIKILVEHLA